MILGSVRIFDGCVIVESGIGSGNVLIFAKSFFGSHGVSGIFGCNNFGSGNGIETDIGLFVVLGPGVSASVIACVSGMSVTCFYLTR